MNHHYDPRMTDAYLQRGAHLRSRAFTAMFGRIGRGLRGAARSIVALVT